jgi:hypothetical protein
MSSGHLKQIGVAVHNYNDMFASIPMTGTPDPAAGGHLSWRVRLLPHIEQRAMFNQVDFSKPWDAAPNTQFHDQMPSTYGQPGKETERSKTQYLVFTHDGPVNVAPPGQLVRLGETWFHPKRGRRLRDCMDGTTNTIMAVEADPERAVPWMKPADLSLDPQNPKAGIGNYRNGGFLVVMGDGSVRFISNKIDNQTMLSLILCNEGQEVDLESLDPRSK